MIFILSFLSILWDFVFEDFLVFFPAFLGVAFYERKNGLFFLTILIRFLAIPGYWYIFILIVFLALDAFRDHFSSLFVPAFILVMIGCFVSGFQVVPFILSTLVGVFFLMRAAKQ
ncbi:hypothetical protein [Thermotoga sp. KOL6]|uniref:hypothetical protein n=1 Tax=Thermotoga sp. KOL6 TaxID=126741 RepID=UPI000C7937BC|nr:hypothetical protein [Thermotoga sp. KOL6]PLV59303.1 hypothetical protein AS005_06075 [Thermotoga sp. KOL6]